MAQVQQMLSSCIIRPSNSPWASPVVMVKKKDGSLRFCVDFRQFNAATVKDAHPIPRIDDLLDALHGARWFSTLDLKSRYWQVPIQEQDKEKMAFRTSSGQLFEFNQVPFGLCNAAATFSWLMDRVLAGHPWETCLYYLDDTIVFAATWEEHLALLRKVFDRLRHAQLKLCAEKCTFAAKEVSYLGHRVTSEGLLPDPTLLAAIRDIGPQKTATEVRSFLDLAGYYWRYVENFAAIAGPLHALTRKDAVFHWSSECQEAFDHHKTLLTTTLTTPNLRSSPFQTNQNQCLLPKCNVSLKVISPRVSSANHLNLVPLLLNPATHPWLPRPLQQYTSQDPPAEAPVNQRPEPAPPRCWSPILNPEQGQAQAILRRPAARQPHSPPSPAHTLSILGTTNPWGQRRTLSPLPAFDWWISSTAKVSTSTR